MITIKSIDDMRSHVSHKEEIREAEIDRNLSCFCYMLSAENTFDSDWARECRGIVFNTSSGQVVSRPLHKFFNVGEREDTRSERVDWSKVIRVMNKRDGSMVHTVIADNGTVKMKSKKTFSSDVAQAAEKFVSENSTTLGQFINAVANRNWTAVFEWTAPDARIVLLYMKPELQLLHLRDNESGQYIDHDEMKKLAANFNVKRVDEVEDFWEPSSSGSRVFNAEKMLDAAKTQEGIEGWVVQFKNGDMVKVKTEWYLRRHRAMTFLRERDIVELTLDEGLDDLKSLLVSEGAEISEIIEIENKVVNDIGSILTLIDSIIEKDGKMERKDFAIKYMNNDAIPTGVFGLLMARYTGKELNVKDWYRKNVLKEKWTLRQLVLVPTIAEGD